MTKEETIQLMAIIKVAYPKFYDNKSDADLNTAVNLWHMMLGDKDYELVGCAVKAFIATSKFPPTIADITENINEIICPITTTAFEAWEKVKKAVRNSTYGSVTEFNKLPQDIQEVVGSPETLRAWGQEDASIFDSVIGSNFQKSYISRCHINKKRQALPQSVQTVISKIADKKMIEGE